MSALTRGLLAFGLIVAVAVVIVAATSDAATSATPTCRTIVHRAKLAGHDEEQAAGIKASARWGWGAEVDLRVTSDGKVALVHDDRLTRITGGADTRQPETLTFPELAAVPLARGGRVINLWAALRAARDTGVKLMLEIKRYPQHKAAWDDHGLPYIANAVTATGMTDRVFIGGVGAKAFHATYPGFRGFIRVDPSDPTTAAGVHAMTWQPDDLIQLGPDHYNAQLITDLRALGHGVASRNAFTAEQVAAGVAVGLRTFQEDRGRRLTDHCKGATS